MKKYQKLMGILVLGALALVGCTKINESGELATNISNDQVQTMKISHTYGEVTVPINPKSVAVFDFGILDILQNLGVEVVTGVVQDTTSRPDYLEAYGSKAYTNIGGLKEPNFEALYELQPEIIFISGRQATHYDELSKIAPVVFMEPDKQDYMGSLKSNVEVLATVFNKEARATELLDALELRVQTIEQTVKSRELNALIAMVSKGEVSVFGEGSRFGVIYNGFGFESADQQIQEANHGQVVTFEYLSKIDPEYLFVIDKNSLESSSETARDTLNNPLVMGIRAAKQDHIVYLDPIAWYISPGGITATETMIEEIEEVLKR